MKKILSLTMLGFLLLATIAFGQQSDASSSTNSQPLPSPSPGTESLPEVIVLGQQIDQAMDRVVPNLGASKYTLNEQQITDQSEGDNAPLYQTLLRVPGIAEDQYSQLHLRGEHAFLQTQIDDVLLPENLTGFGEEFSPRFIKSISVIDGTLPAQYGFATAGIIDIHTKNGDSSNGGDISMYGGAFNTVNPSFEFGENFGKWSVYLQGSYLFDSLGINNTTSSRNAIHDNTWQYKCFADISYLIDETSKLTLLLGGNHSYFQIPANPGQPSQYTLNAAPQSAYDSSDVADNQLEQNTTGILSYKKTEGDLSLKLSGVFQESGINFMPDEEKDLIFNGVTSAIQRQLFAEGLNEDTSYHLNDQHTLRAGFTYTFENASINTQNQAFPVAPNGTVGTTPISIPNNSTLSGALWGFYLQDEWKPIQHLTVNFGVRFDAVTGWLNENQVSPRINASYELTTNTLLHAGYARYFTPPPLETIPQSTETAFAGTTGAPEVSQSSPVQAERSHYFDTGVTQKLAKGWNSGLDAYLKLADQQLDEGQFGNAVIYSPFNYQHGRIYGVELTSDYKNGGFRTYGNVAVSVAQGENIDSAQFLFSQAELNYIQNHWVYLDHDQRVTFSTGASYQWNKTLFLADLTGGTGLRAGFANEQELSDYDTLNLGIQQVIPITGKQELKLRVDVVNAFNTPYELRSGTGIGVAAPSYGMPRGIFGTVSYSF
jgi:outer membrane receptor protein involved in Fe transport